MTALQSKVRTCWWFQGNGLEAARFYCTLLPDSRVESEFSQRDGQEPVVVEFTLAGAPMMILNGGDMFSQTGAASISVLTDDQAETDELWESLTADGGEESMCGWLKDKYGVSWQVTPHRLVELTNSEDHDAGNGQDKPCLR
ncbi:MAG: VOC family protein [Litorimonas sp.]